MTTTDADFSTDPIHACIERWHQHMRGQLDGGLDAILHPDVVFLSPIVFTPQEGRDITKLYLTAAGGTLGGDTDTDTDSSDGSDSSGGFGYTKEICQGHAAMLEFETQVEGKYVNGVDIITCDDDGMIIEFRVMIRPLQAINLVHAQMKAMLERLSS
ncbi:hypothetical protein [Ilumatobacter nonamiensis]|uniref:hypothetical protein n=1 Tax=Ilumatobacter nonamiensis TaxID=467093 RepID=UPI00034D757C|nr:hypothetical protein [Ilumatobacter nonamiensis]